MPKMPPNLVGRENISRDLILKIFQVVELTDSEDDISRQKKNSLLMVDFDCSPLEPRQLCEAEEQPGLNMEKLLLERVMLR